MISDRMIGISLCLFSVLISSISQIFLKKSAMKQYKSWIFEYVNPSVVGAYSVFFAAALISTISFRYIGLALGSVLEAFSYFFVLILSAIFLKEPFSLRKLLGFFIVLAGVILFVT